MDFSGGGAVAGIAKARQTKKVTQRKCSFKAELNGACVRKLGANESIVRCWGRQHEKLTHAKRQQRLSKSRWTEV